jgi:hypothetical protein
LAGRRIDLENEKPPRFPLQEVGRVRAELDKLFRSSKVEVLVSSAACGADLIALDVAGNIGIERHVILPYAPPIFRSTSVTDRPGNWGDLFDRIIQEVSSEGQLVVREFHPNDPSVYSTVNELIVDCAVSVSGNTKGSKRREILALLVWDGARRDSADSTADFRLRAIRAGLPVLELRTTANQPQSMSGSMGE